METIHPERWPSGGSSMETRGSAVREKHFLLVALGQIREFALWNIQEVIVIHGCAIQGLQSLPT